MHKETKLATFVENGKEYAGKREVYLADTLLELQEVVTANNLNTTALDVFNSKVVVLVQNSIRDAIRVKNGLKVKTSGGKVKSYADVEDA